MEPWAEHAIWQSWLKILLFKVIVYSSRAYLDNCNLDVVVDIPFVATFYNDNSLLTAIGIQRCL